SEKRSVEKRGVGEVRGLVEMGEARARVRALAVWKALRIPQIVECFLNVCAITERLDRRPAAATEGDRRRDDQSLAEPIGEGCRIRQDVRTVVPGPNPRRGGCFDVAKALDPRWHLRG